MFFLYEIIQPICVSVLVSMVAFVLGRCITARITYTKQLSAVSFGFTLLLGYALFGYGAVFISLFAELSKALVWILIIGTLIIGRRYVKESYTYVFSKIKSISKRSPVSILLLVSILGAVCFYGISALVPQYRIDALAYHVPEAVQIAQSGILSLTGEGIFFGNMPILVESMYAPLSAISNYSAMNLLHYSLFLSACIALFGLVRQKFGTISGLLSVLGLFSMYELMVNATNAYVDAATVSFELMALLLFVSWVLEQKKDYLLLSGMLFGAAMSTKYLSMYGLAIVSILFIAFHVLKKISFKEFVLNSLRFGMPLLAFAIFWYAKNAILYGNPIYPFFFGHPGFTDHALEVMNAGFKQFGDRSLRSFVVFPFVIFKHPLYVHVLLATLITPFALLLKKNKEYIRIVLLIAATCFSLWFFIISHQRRFGMLPIALIMIIAATVVGRSFEKYKRYITKKVVLTILVIGLVVISAVGYKARNNYYVQVKQAELAYVLGIDSIQDFYNKRDMGPQFAISTYINDQMSDEEIFNMWSDPAFFLEKNNTYVHPLEYIETVEDVSTSTLLDFFAERNITYINTLSEEGRNAYFARPEFTDDPSQEYYYERVLQHVYKMDEIVPQIGERMYDEEERILYKLDMNTDKQ